MPSSAPCSAPHSRSRYAVPAHGADHTVAAVDRVLSDEVIRLLPVAYVAALECVANGDSVETIAERAGVDESAVPALIRLATAKLLQIQAGLDART